MVCCRGACDKGGVKNDRHCKHSQHGRLPDSELPDIGVVHQVQLRQLEQNKLADEREDRHWEEISKLTTAVNNNTEVLRDLVKQTIKED